MPYLSFEDRTPDSQYQALLAAVMDHGLLSPTRQGPPARTLMQQTMRFDLANGFPVITERSIKGFWRKPIAELCAFINGATTLEQFEAFGCNWWGPWATEAKTSKRGLEPGSIGPGSYGGAFKHFPVAQDAQTGQDTSSGFDQYQHLVEQIREFPSDRTHFVSPWIPYYLVRGEGKTPKATIAPCHGWVHVRILEGGLHLHMFQRSGDLPVGVPSNMIQYSALALMLGHLTGFPAAAYYHTISDAHVYDDQVDSVREMLTRAPRRLPTISLNESGLAVDDIHDFRGEHFELTDYDPHPAITKIPVAP